MHCRPDFADQGPSPRTPLPTGGHQVPARLVEPRHSLWSQPLAHRPPELLLVLASVVVGREVVAVAADVPEENAKGVHVHRVVVRPTEHLRCHVDGSAHQRVAHHCFRLAEAEVR